MVNNQESKFCTECGSPLIEGQCPNCDGLSGEIINPEGKGKKIVPQPAKSTMPLLVGAVVGVVLLVGGYFGYQAYQKQATVNAENQVLKVQRVVLSKYQKLNKSLSIDNVEEKQVSEADMAKDLKQVKEATAGLVSQRLEGEQLLADLKEEVNEVQEKIEQLLDGEEVEMTVDSDAEFEAETEEADGEVFDDTEEEAEIAGNRRKSGQDLTTKRIWKKIQGEWESMEAGYGDYPKFLAVIKDDSIAIVTPPQGLMGVEFVPVAQTLHSDSLRVDVAQYQTMGGTRQKGEDQTYYFTLNPATDELMITGDVSPEVEATLFIRKSAN